MNIFLRSSLLSLSCVLVTFGTSAANAQEHGDKPHGEGEKSEKHRGHEEPGPGVFIERLKQLDAYIQSKEDDVEASKRWTELAERLKEKRPGEFKKLDTNSDGIISRDEAQAALATITAHLKERFADAFTKIDSDHDGSLSHEEIRAAHLEERKGRDKREDRRHDDADDQHESGDDKPHDH